ncbi:hypothetical protein [Shewanella sp. SG41-4]|uniref:hypothetical protein n=1 Tax=Shewanella TaxID=22 RepID=UPI0016030C86|nr:hypothetical protein [Shewanella sp. SG41-4]MBB1438449.1 hypothetical protein [Shewanella sp. SG41-4]
MDISRITSQHEGTKEIVLLLDKLVGGSKYLHLHDTPIIDIILLKAMLAWDREQDAGLEQQFTMFSKSILYDLYQVTHFKVSFRVNESESIHWDCISQTFEEFKQDSKNNRKKLKKCDCFKDNPTPQNSCNCLKIEYIDKRSLLSNDAISLLLARHVFNRRVLNLLGLPLPARQTVYSLSSSLIEHP